MLFKNKILFGAIILLISIYQSESQEVCLNTPSRKEFKGLILLKTGEKIRSDNIIFNNNFVLYMDGMSKLDSIAIEKVNIIRANDGNYALEGALLGGLAFLVFEVWYDYNVNKKIDNSVATVAWVTGVGVGIGLIAGLLTSKQKTIYRCGKMQIGILGNRSYNLGYKYSNLNIINFYYNF